MDYARKVSILIAAYNVEKYIEQCILSVCNQRYRNIEIIVVNDCSNDSTGEICNRIALSDDRIKVIHHKKNMKLPATRNTGLDNATGEYIVFVDGDDWLAPDFVDYMLGLIISTESDMAISRTNFTTRDTRQIERDYTEIWDKNTSTANFLYSRIPIGAWDKIYSRKFIEENQLRFKPLFTAEGFRFISDCSQRANQVAVGNRRVYYYRLNNPNSATTLPDIRQGLGAIEAIDGIEKDLIIKSPFVMKSIRHHRWINYKYTLQIIIESKAEDKHCDIYTNCLRYIRKNGIRIFLDTSMSKYKIKILLYTLFPVKMVQKDIDKKKREFQKDTLYK